MSNKGGLILGDLHYLLLHVICSLFITLNHPSVLMSEVTLFQGSEVHGHISGEFKYYSEVASYV